MDPAAQLALTSALLWLVVKTAATEKPERPVEESGSKDVQDPLGLKQSVFIVTPIVMVRKQPRKKNMVVVLNFEISRPMVFDFKG